MPNVVQLTPEAKNHLIDICTNEDQNYIHLSVAGGGCAGFSYRWGFANTPEANDEVIEIAENKKLVIDGLSVMHLIGMEIDYKKDIFGSILHIDNPNVTSSCGCGESFNIF
jgi:iron-sulfur cluster assembly accessory protein|tara:strand:+ start:159 stop:491 length:333 start_codon:yes stop_codon:yes gene_type:complete